MQISRHKKAFRVPYSIIVSRSTEIVIFLHNTQLFFFFFWVILMDIGKNIYDRY